MGFCLPTASLSSCLFLVPCWQWYWSDLLKVSFSFLQRSFISWPSSHSMFACLHVFLFVCLLISSFVCLSVLLVWLWRWASHHAQQALPEWPPRQCSTPHPSCPRSDSAPAASLAWHTTQMLPIWKHWAIETTISCVVENSPVWRCYHGSHYHLFTGKLQPKVLFKANMYKPQLQVPLPLLPDSILSLTHVIHEKNWNSHYIPTQWTR